MVPILTPVGSRGNIWKQSLSDMRGGPMAVGNSHVERSMSAPAAPSTRRTRFARRGPTVDEGLLGVGLLLGPANVIMQLARPGVGYGVLESRVESGRVDLHPIKRARTTFTYPSVATKGS